MPDPANPVNANPIKNRLATAIAWLDSHINYERTGPSPSAPDGIHDPQRRIRHLRSFMELMGQPQQLYPSIHLTGTNGKTSTSRLITALLQAQGLNVGTYTSPHLQRVNERISTNGEPLDNESLVELLEALALLEPMLGAVEGVGTGAGAGLEVDERASYFELLTAAAFRHFADVAVGAAVVEVGVGGQWDATNVVDGLVAVVTNIGLDHAAFLGPTRRHVAEQKAGIIKPQSTLVLSEPDPELRQVFVDRNPAKAVIIDQDYGYTCNDMAVGGRLLDLRTPLATYDEVFLSLHGAYQGANAATALMAAEAFFEQPLPDEVVREAFGSVRSPGRMEVVHRQPLCVLDGAHNVAGAEALAATLEEEFAVGGRRILVVGLLDGHEPADLLPALRAQQARLVVACTAPSPRAIPAAAIAAECVRLGIVCRVVESVANAVHEAFAVAEQDDVVVVTGSLYVVGAARTALGTF